MGTWDPFLGVKRPGLETDHSPPTSVEVDKTWAYTPTAPHTSKSKLLCDWKSVNQSVSQYVLVSSTLVGLATRYYFLSECCCLKFAVLYLLAPSLTRGRVCNLQCNHSIVRVAQNPKPYFTVSSETPLTWRARFPYLYPPGTGWPSYTPGHWVPFTSSWRSVVS
jgi:hypothetical protein